MRVRRLLPRWPICRAPRWWPQGFGLTIQPAGLALLAGLPLGVAVGRWAWALFTGGLGVPSGALVPVSFVLLIVPAAILLANAVAYWPGSAAAGLSPAGVLRAE